MKKILLILVACFLLTNVNVFSQVKISFPLDYYVFQRSNLSGFGEGASINIAGEVRNRDNCRIVVDRLNEYGAFVSNYFDNALNSSHVSPAYDNLCTNCGNFFVFTALPTGWYRITVKDGSLNTSSVKVGVGEVFIIAGQSNAQGAGDVYYIDSTPNGSGGRTPISNLDCVVGLKSNFMTLFPNGSYHEGDPEKPLEGNDGYVNIVPPIMGPINSSNPHIGPTGSRPWFYQYLGNRIVGRESGKVIPVAFFNVGMGGSSILNWKNSLEKTKQMFSNNYVNNLTPLTTEYQRNPWVSYNNFDNRHPYITLKNSIAFYASIFGIRSVIWHQGEAETQSIISSFSGYNINDYAPSLTALINDTRAIIPNLPWSISKVSYLGGTVKPEVIYQQSSVKASLSRVTWASQNSDSFGSAYRQADDVHFNRDGLIMIADEIYSNLSTQIFSLSPIPNHFPIVKLVQNHSTNHVTINTPNSYSRYHWSTSVLIPTIFHAYNQTTSTTSNSYTSTFGRLMGYAKTSSGLITMMLPHINTKSSSSFRIAASENSNQIEASIYPNPSPRGKSKLTLEYNLYTDSDNLLIEILDYNGHTIYVRKKTDLKAGSYKDLLEDFKLNEYNGQQVYFYRLTTNEGKSVTGRLLTE